MTYISYAQNFEDVMLARALADVDQGFYVDVGAQDPLIDSVTRMFYDRGWHGINIEPVPHWFERLQAERARDTNLMCAVAASDGTLVLHEFSDSGLSTASEAYARGHAAAGRSMVKRQVPMVRLDEILAKHVPGVVHFLKIDVEGMEQEVLAGLSLKRYRPWILVIEATQPNSTVDVSQVWEPSVLGSGYRLVYRDGLNRFYLAEEQMARAPAFDVPPNVFDEFISYREYAGNQYALSLEARLQALHDRAEELRRDLLVVTDTASARQKRVEELDAVLAQRQSVLEERARTAEAYRVDLVAIAETAERRQQRIDELENSLSKAHRDLSKAGQEVNLVAETAENRRILIEGLEARLCASDARLEGLQRELNTVYASYSWRLTAFLRILSRSARRVAGQILRRAAALPLLRAVGSRMLVGGMRRRVLSVAGFEPESRLDGRAFPPTDALGTGAGQIEISRAGMRVYRLLAMAHDRGVQDKQ